MVLGAGCGETTNDRRCPEDNDGLDKTSIRSAELREDADSRKKQRNKYLAKDKDVLEDVPIRRFEICAKSSSKRSI